jgi:hypothetical protein
MGTIMFLEIVVHFHSYARNKILHRRECLVSVDSVHFILSSVLQGLFDNRLHKAFCQGF